MKVGNVQRLHVVAVKSAVVRGFHAPDHEF